MEFELDRSLPVTLSAQLQGQIEYGIAFGTISEGSRLPSTRDLADRLGVSPVTVFNVYKALRNKGLLETRRGSGTFIRANATLTNRSTDQLAAIHDLIGHLLQTADKYGLSRTDLKRIINLRLDPRRSTDLNPLKLVFVGNFINATRSYVNVLSQHLLPDDEITASSLNLLAHDAGELERIASADAVITLAHRVAEVRELLSNDTPIVLLKFIPSKKTRKALAELSPATRTGLISTYPEFLSSLKAMVLDFAPHIQVTSTGVPESSQLQNVLAYSDVVIYTSGSESSLAGISPHVRAIEFSYEPDPRSVEHDLIPVLNSIRAKMV